MARRVLPIQVPPMRSTLRCSVTKLPGGPALDIVVLSDFARFGPLSIRCFQQLNPTLISVDPRTLTASRKPSLLAHPTVGVFGAVY